MDDYFSPHLDADALAGFGSIALAHIGDGVYELLVRTYLCTHGGARVRNLHRATVELVRAATQARFYETILPHLTEEEAAVLRRGRNAKVNSVPPHAARADYQRATALEALIGWLYLRGARERINTLFAICMEEYHAT